MKSLHRKLKKDLKHKLKKRLYDKLSSLIAMGK